MNTPRTKHCSGTFTAAIAAAILLAAPATIAANVSEVSVSLNSTAYVKVAEGTLKDTISLSGITAFNGTEQVDFVCVSNRPYATINGTFAGLPDDCSSFVHQLSVFNNWDGSRTRSYRVQLAQPDGTTDIYARIPCVTMSQEGVNLVDYPDIRDFKKDASKIAASYETDADIAGFTVTKLRLRRIDAPYIESDGTSGISTGYRMKGTSRVEVDFSMPNVDDPNEWTQCKVLGTDTASIEPNLAITLYLTYNANNQNKFFAIRAKTSDANESIKYKLGVDTDRHTAIVDLLEDKAFFITGGTTNSLVGGNPSFDRDFSNAEAVLPLSLFGRFANAYATTFAQQTKSRIYGVRIFENGIPVHNFVPCLKEGVACFKDLVNGGFIIGENASAFTAGGDVPAFADDGYVSTAANADGGKLYFDTGYKATAKTAVALDYALTVNTNLAGTVWKLFEGGWDPYYGFNINGNHGLRFNAGGNTYLAGLTSAFKETLYDDKDVRRIVFLDNLHPNAAVVTSGFTNQTATFSVSNTKTQTWSVKLASGWKGDNEFAAIKIYGCKIWENGALVRDFEPCVNNGTPGLRDNITGAFIAASRGSGDTTSALAYGGAIVEDAYLEPTGSVGINTGVKLNGRSRLEVDFSLTVTNANTKNWRVFGTDTQETNLKTWLGYDSAFNTRMEMAGNNRYPIKADTARHLAGMDMTSGKFLFVTGTTTNALASVTTDLSELEASLPLPLFGRYSNAEGTAYHNYTVPSARIYSVRIYESDELKHEFIPYSRGGVAGFYDTVTGDVISNGSSFTFGGKGQDHGQLKAYVNPQHAATVSAGKTVALTAYAPGASSYRWLMDGEPVSGGSDGTLAVEWARGGTRTEEGNRHAYQAIGIFDIGGATVESEPSAAETVTSILQPFVLIMR